MADNSNYLSDIFKIIQNFVSQDSKTIFKIHFIFKDIVTKDAIPPDKVATKLGLKIGEYAPAGLCPRLTLARSEAYWLMVSIPTMIKAFHNAGIKFPFVLSASYPESIIHDNNGSYLTNPLLLQPKLNISQSISLLHDFAVNGENKDRETDYIFNLDRFFEIHPSTGFLPIDDKSLVFMASSCDDMGRRTATTIALQKAEDKGAMVLEKPRYWLTDYNHKNFGFGDAKSFAKNLLPHYYPDSYEGRDTEEALAFIHKNNLKFVIKPASSANGQGVRIIDYRKKSKKKITQEFIKLFQEYLDTYQGQQRIIIQKYLHGIEKNGEVRVFIYDNKVFPIGIRLIPQNGESLSKIFMNASIESVFLGEDIIAIAQQFIEKSKPQGILYYGLDVIKDNDDKIYVTEANFLVSGFFDRIAHFMDTRKNDIDSYLSKLPEHLKPYVISSHLNDTVYKQIHKFLKSRVAINVANANEKALEILRSPFNFREILKRKGQ